MLTPADAIAPDADLILALALAARDALPEAFLVPAREVRLRIEDLAEPEILEALEIADPFELTGLYDGIPVTEKSVSDQPMGPDTIWLYRRPILDYWAEHEETLGAVVTHVLVHEVGHHFGLSDADMEKIEAEAG